MSLSLASFRELYPEFAPTSDATITAMLAQVEGLVSNTLTDDARDEIVGLETAARLARSPQGRKANLVSQDGSSTYSRELCKRRKQHACLLLRVW